MLTFCLHISSLQVGPGVNRDLFYPDVASYSRWVFVKLCSDRLGKSQKSCLLWPWMPIDRGRLTATRRGLGCGGRSSSAIPRSWVTARPIVIGYRISALPESHINR